MVLLFPPWQQIPVSLVFQATSKLALESQKRWNLVEKSRAQVKPERYQRSIKRKTTTSNFQVNSGAIMSASLLLYMVKPELTVSEKFEYVHHFFSR